MKRNYSKIIGKTNPPNPNNFPKTYRNSLKYFQFLIQLFWKFEKNYLENSNENKSFCLAISQWKTLLCSIENFSEKSWSISNAIVWHRGDFMKLSRDKRTVPCWKSNQVFNIFGFDEKFLSLAFVTLAKLKEIIIKGSQRVTSTAWNGSYCGSFFKSRMLLAVLKTASVLFQKKIMLLGC